MGVTRLIHWIKYIRHLSGKWVDNWGSNILGVVLIFKREGLTSRRAANILRGGQYSQRGADSPPKGLSFMEGLSQSLKPASSFFTPSFFSKH